MYLSSESWLGGAGQPNHPTPSDCRETTESDSKRRNTKERASDLSLLVGSWMLFMGRAGLSTLISSDPTSSPRASIRMRR